MTVAPDSKILIVDDKPENLLAMEKLLKPLPAKVYKAQSGNEALELVLQHDFAVILMDAQMPDLDGFETAALMREYEWTKHTPIIFVTAISKDEIHVMKGYENGAVDYLFKPVNDNILRSKVNIFLDINYQKNKKLERILDDLKKAQEELKRRNLELDHLAHYDVLTDLPNRLQFEEAINRQVAHANRHQRQFALLFIDVDNFKNVNDTMGHQVGDLLLKEVSTRLQACLRKDDFIARIGGDEFAILLNDITNFTDAGVVAAKLLKSLESTCLLDNKNFTPKISIGISCFPVSGYDSTSLTKHADIAMYRAKETGGNNFQYYTKELHETYLKRVEIEKALSTALEEDKFCLEYQPIFDLKTKKITAIEALIRMRHSDGEKLISPADFIAVAESIGLIKPIGEWVLAKACEQYHEWYQMGLHTYQYMINLSPIQLVQPELPQILQGLLTKYNLPPHNIGLELTETAVMEKYSGAEECLQSLHDLGINISIDDFGTGYSSLSRLRLLPINTLKIDKSFISEIGVSDNGVQIVKSILALAHSLSLHVIAEGIETEDQMDFLVKQRCKYGQGFYLCKPQSAEKITELLLAGNKDK